MNSAPAPRTGPTDGSSGQRRRRRTNSSFTPSAATLLNANGPSKRFVAARSIIGNCSMRPKRCRKDCASFRADSAVEQLASEPKTVIYRIVQESLTNVYKYAAACRVEVIIRQTNDGIRVTVKDDGKGFQPDQLEMSLKDKSGLGLMGMQERLRLVNGQFAVKSAPGKGTTIQALIPCKPQKQ